MTRRISGVFLFAIGLALAGWVAFNLLIQVQPEAEGLSPFPPVLLSGFFIWAGYRWITGREAG